MKYFLCAVFLLSILAIRANANCQDFSKDNPGNTTAVIDAGDTVVFDISQSVVAGNQVTFPVYFISDDTINALDFSMMYDEFSFSLDTIIDLTTYLQPVYNFNSGTLYFTSYSLQEIDHNANLISIRLNILDHYLCSDDLNSLLVYLNGDACSVKVVECLTDAIPEIENSVIDVFPNPATYLLNISCKENATVSLLDLKGSIVFTGVNDHVNGETVIDVSQFQKGIYFLSVNENDKVSFQKIVIE